MLNKIKGINLTKVFLLLLIISSFNIIDAVNFLNSANLTKSPTSFQDVVLYILAGLSSSGPNNLVDVIRFSMPSILCTLFINSYLADTFQKGNIYCSIIRYKSYKSWIRKNILNLCFLINIFFLIYYILILFLGFIFIENTSGCTETFYIIYPGFKNDNLFILLIYQYLLTISTNMVILIITVFLSLKLNDLNHIFTYTSLGIMFFTALGKYDLINPFMLSKHSVFGFNTNPIITIIISIIIALCLYIYLIKYIHVLVRRNRL